MLPSRRCADPQRLADPSLGADPDAVARVVFFEKRIRPLNDRDARLDARQRPPLKEFLDLSAGLLFSSQVRGKDTRVFGPATFGRASCTPYVNP